MAEAKRLDILLWRFRPGTDGLLAARRVHRRRCGRTNLYLRSRHLADGGDNVLKPGRSSASVPRCSNPTTGESRSLVDLVTWWTEFGGLRWRAPAGHVWTSTSDAEGSGRVVKRRRPGGAGKCITPFSKIFAGTHLARFDQTLGICIGRAGRAIFHDSFEYAAIGPRSLRLIPQSGRATIW